MIFYITEYLWFTFRKPSYYAVNCTLYATTNIVFIKIIPVQFCLFSFFVGHLSVVSLQLHLRPKRFWNDTVYWLFLWTAIILFFLLYYIELLQFPLLRVENPWACFSGEQEQKASFSPLPIREWCREAAWAHYRQELSRECCSLHGFWAVAWALGTVFRCPLASTREKRQLESYRAPSLGLSSAQANRRIKVGPGWPAFFPLNCWWKSQPAAILWVSFLFQLCQLSAWRKTGMAFFPVLASRHFCWTGAAAALPAEQVSPHHCTGETWALSLPQSQKTSLPCTQWQRDSAYVGSGCAHLSSECPCTFGAASKGVPCKRKQSLWAMAAECFSEDTQPLLLPALGASAGQYRVGTGCPCVLALSSENTKFELCLYMLSPCMSCHTVQHCTAHQERSKSTCQMIFTWGFSFCSHFQQEKAPWGGMGCPGPLLSNAFWLLQRCQGHQALDAEGYTWASPWQLSAA